MNTQHITDVLIEKNLYQRRRIEEMHAGAVASARGVNVHLLSVRQATAFTETAGGAMAVGSVPFVIDVMRAQGIEPPQHVPYPEVLSPYLHRKVGYASRLKDLIAEAGRPLFVKPASGWKKWTGEVFDVRAPRSRNSDVYWSEPVIWRSEWRAYTVNGVVLDLQPAPGTTWESPQCDRAVVVEAVAKLASLPGSAKGVIVDFGVLSSGETALVEVNDGFSFGAYGSVAADTCWSVWSARWLQLSEAARS